MEKTPFWICILVRSMLQQLQPTWMNEIWSNSNSIRSIQIASKRVNLDQLGRTPNDGGFQKSLIESFKFLKENI